MILLDRYRGLPAVVLGYGRTGAATARALSAGGASVSVWDDSSASRCRAAADGFSIADENGREVAGAAIVAVSPGVPAHGPGVHSFVSEARAAGVSIDNDVGLFFEWLVGQSDERVPRVVGVTGTNGKSTSTALITHVLRENGMSAVAAGNIGLPVLALDRELPLDAVVLELSSFQLEVARCLEPHIGVLLNLEEDHLDRHGTFERYVAAKERLFAAKSGERHYVIGVEEDAGQRLAERLSLPAPPASQHPGRTLDVFGPPDRVAQFASGCRIQEGRYVHFLQGTPIGTFRATDTSALRGAHNLRNEAAAFLVASRFVPNVSAVRRALRSFPGLPHRLERLGNLAGVEYVNDSKATNPASASRALATLQRIRWIAGGRPKPGGFRSLRPYFDRVVSAYLIGEGAEDIASALGEDASLKQCGDLETAFTRAASDAEPGDTVLLSPACASFDQFRNFEMRGEAFRRLYLQRAGRVPDNGGSSQQSTGRMATRDSGTGE